MCTNLSSPSLYDTATHSCGIYMNGMCSSQCQVSCTQPTSINQFCAHWDLVFSEPFVSQVDGTDAMSGYTFRRPAIPPKMDLGTWKEESPKPIDIQG